jgi:hypothetical protein
MKALPVFFTWVAVLTWGVAASAQNQKLDVVMEGPWIYYQDDNFTDSSGKTASVLVAMAPTAGHNLPTFTTGQGGKLPGVGVYCVSDGDMNCFTQKSKFSAKACPTTGTTYPDLKPICVKTQSGANWHWYSSLAPDFFYMILPMPDSISNDGIDMMALENTLPKSTAASSNSETPHSIGLQLHYDSWPTKTIRLISCTKPGASSTTDTCAMPVPVATVPDQDQSGTLNIAMTSVSESGKAQECGYHLRSAYNHRITFLDPTDLSGGHNVNYDGEYTDLRSENTGQYEQKCYSCDPQNPHHLPFPLCPKEHKAKNYAQVNAKESLGRIIVDLKSIPDPKRKDALQIPALSGVSENISGRFPSQAQLSQIEQLLDLSIAALKGVDQSKSKDKTAAGALPKESPASTALREERELKNYVLFSGTSGKDCKAAQMLITLN